MTKRKLKYILFGIFGILLLLLILNCNSYAQCPADSVYKELKMAVADLNKQITEYKSSHSDLTLELREKEIQRDWSLAILNRFEHWYNKEKEGK